MSIIQTIKGELIKLKEIRLNKNIISYIICIVIASILWFLNTLEKEYTIDLTYPVKYTNLPDDKLPVEDLPTQLRLVVRAKGSALLGYKIKTSFLPITLNFDNYSKLLEANQGIYGYTLLTNTLEDKIAGQLGNEIKLLNIYPEKITFKFATAQQKKVAIHPIIDHTLKKQYILTQVYTKPDSVWVSSSSAILDTLRYIPTTSLYLNNIDKNISRKQKLAHVPGCTFKEESIEIFLEVEKFTEAKQSIPITVINVPDSMNLRLFPDNVKISYEIGLSKYDQINDDDFIFSVEYPKKVNSSYLEIKITKAPLFIKNLSFSPEKVEYILEKK